MTIPNTVALRPMSKPGAGTVTTVPGEGARSQPQGGVANPAQARLRPHSSITGLSARSGISKPAGDGAIRMNGAALGLLKGMSHASAGAGAHPSAGQLQLRARMQGAEHAGQKNAEFKHTELKHAELVQAEKMDADIPEIDISGLGAGALPGQLPMPPSSPMSNHAMVPAGAAQPSPAGEPAAKASAPSASPMPPSSASTHPEGKTAPQPSPAGQPAGNAAAPSASSTPPSSPSTHPEPAGEAAPQPSPAGKPAPKASEPDDVSEMRSQADTFAASQREMADIQMMQSTIAAQTSALTAMNDALNERTKKVGQSMKDATSA